MKNTRVIATLSLALAGVACQEQPSEDPPIHLNLNMDFQTNMKPQEENEFFADGRAMRPQVPGTVARGTLKENSELHAGKTGEAYVAKNPVRVTQEMLKRGQDRYDIFCAPCHSRTGAGDGMIVKHGMLRPPNFHEDRIVNMPDGEIYSAIVNGVRGNMPSYAYAIPVEDRWAIVGYMRALQLSRRATLDLVPADVATSKGWKR